MCVCMFMCVPHFVSEILSLIGTWGLVGQVYWPVNSRILLVSTSLSLVLQVCATMYDFMDLGSGD